MSTMASMSGASASVTTSACKPSMTARACLPEPPWDWLTVDVVASLLLPVVGEDLVVLLVKFASWIVGDVEQLNLFGACGRKAQTEDKQKNGCNEGGFYIVYHVCRIIN